jgi:hypothetical protein
MVEYLKGRDGGREGGKGGKKRGRERETERERERERERKMEEIINPGWAALGHIGHRHLESIQKNDYS